MELECHWIPEKLLTCSFGVFFKSFLMHQSKRTKLTTCYRKAEQPLQKQNMWLLKKKFKNSLVNLREFSSKIGTYFTQCVFCFLQLRASQVKRKTEEKSSASKLSEPENNVQNKLQCSKKDVVMKGHIKRNMWSKELPSKFKVPR